MRIHRIFPGTTFDKASLLRKVAKAKSYEASALWMNANDFSNFAGHNWLNASVWDRLTYVESTSPKQLAKLAEDSSAGGTSLQVNTVQVVEHLQPSTQFHNSNILLRPRTGLYRQFWLEAMDRLKDKKVYFEFLPWTADHPERTTVGEIRELIRASKNRSRDFRLETFPGLETWDDRIEPSLELESSQEVVKLRRTDSGKKLVSVVIPTYNNAVFVESVVKNLLHQSLPAAAYEIIVVDDGSSDDSFERLCKILKTTSPGPDLTFIHFPRRARRTTGDHQYRAGISRNLAVRYARGEFLAFVDSDMVVAPDYLKKVLAALERYDVVQCRRLHIYPERCRGGVLYSDVNVETETYIEEEHYWNPFFKTNDWQNMPEFWKYVCTYGLSLRKQDFLSAGRFKRNFTTYGFEDVDLGYELALSGKSFHLLPENALHLTPAKERSEFGHSRWRRHGLLSRTAKTFFRQHLDPKIYDMLSGYMSEFAWPHRLKKNFLNQASLEQPFPGGQFE